MRNKMFLKQIIKSYKYLPERDQKLFIIIIIIIIINNR